MTTSLRPVRLLLGLALASAGCASTSLSAPDARLPVLLGPVVCIDCAAQQAEVALVPRLRFGINRRTVGVGVSQDSREKATPFTECGAALGGGPCQQGDLRLVTVRAHAWALVFPLLFYMADLEIEGEAVQVTEPKETCAAGL